MPYIDKQPCKSAWVALEACPPHEIIHKIDDYLYYDACNFPEIHKNYFETAETVKSWLLTELDNHKNIARPVWVQIFMFKERLTIKIFKSVLALSKSVFLTANDVASEFFYLLSPCKISSSPSQGVLFSPIRYIILLW